MGSDFNLLTKALNVHSAWLSRDRFEGRESLLSREGRPRPVEHVGKVDGAGPAGEILVRVSRPWRWGEGVRLVDRRGRALGRVSGVIGPAAAPWLVLKPLDQRAGHEAAVRLRGADAYLEELPEAETAAPAPRPRTQGRPTGRRGRRGKQ